MARDQPGGDNDLALITLDRKVNFTEDVRPICVGDTRTAVRPEDKVTLGVRTEAEIFSSSS